MNNLCTFYTSNINVANNMAVPRIFIQVGVTSYKKHHFNKVSI